MKPSLSIAMLLASCGNKDDPNAAAGTGTFVDSPVGELETGDSGVRPPTGSDSDTGTECPPKGAQRRLAGELELGRDAWATVVGEDGSLFGYSVAGAGDITGDGLADVAVVHDREALGTDEGGVYLLPSPLPPGESDVHQSGVRFVDADPGEGGTNWFTPAYGTVAPTVDLNGDGLPELAIGSPDWAEYSVTDGTGIVYLVGSPITEPPGGQTPFEPGYATIVNKDAISLGYAITAADVDGDAIEDLLVSAPQSQDGDGGFRGKIYIFSGPVSGGRTNEVGAAYTIYGDNPGPLLTGGGPIAMGEQLFAGDITGDGVSDVVVTSPASYLEGVRTTGDVYVFDGPIEADVPTSAATGTLQGDPSVISDALGGIANWIGDTDGDGYGEFGLWSTGGIYDPPGNGYLFNGAVTGVFAATVRADSHFYGLDDNDNGGVPASAGDLDQDGLDDVALGSTEVGEDTRGAVFVYYGPVPRGSFAMNDAPDATLWGGGGWPVAVAGVGDVDGDCMPDLAVGERVRDRVTLLRGGTY